MACIISPGGLLLEDDLSHSGNRHAEEQLRQLGIQRQPPRGRAAAPARHTAATATRKSSCASSAYSGNRHAEEQLRQLGMGLRKSMAKCRNLAEQMGTDLYQRCEVGMRATNDAVLAQLTLVTGRVEGRVEELSWRRRR
jgi:hypothetical protein